MNVKLKDRSQRMLVKRMVELSMSDGLVSSERVEAVLRSVRDHGVRDRGGILKAYLGAIRKLLRQNTVEVSHAGSLDPQRLVSFLRSLEQRSGRRLTLVTRADPSLIAGTRVKLGDHVWERSVRGHLEALKSRIR